MAPMPRRNSPAARALVPAGEIGAVIEAARGIERRAMTECGPPTSMSLLPTAERAQIESSARSSEMSAVAHQQAHEVTLVGAVVRAFGGTPRSSPAMILQQNLVRPP
jgi:hypothetical protein